MTTDKFDRYLAIVEWAKARYRDETGAITLRVGNGIAGLPSLPSVGIARAHMVPTRYTVIEDLAAERYMAIARHYPNYSIATAYVA